MLQIKYMHCIQDIGVPDKSLCQSNPIAILIFLASYGLGHVILKSTSKSTSLPFEHLKSF